MRTVSFARSFDLPLARRWPVPALIEGNILYALIWKHAMCCVCVCVCVCVCGCVGVCVCVCVYVCLSVYVCMSVCLLSPLSISLSLSLPLSLLSVSLSPLYSPLCESPVPVARLVKSLLSRSSAVSLEKLSSPKGFQVGWSGGLFRLAAEAGAWGTEVLPCRAGWYTLCWEDCGELDGVALADLIVPR